MSVYTEHYIGCNVNGFYLKTEPFTNANDAIEAFKIINSSNSNVNYELMTANYTNLNQSNTESYTETYTESYTQSNMPFQGMVYETYGKGFLLRCSSNEHPDYGTKYFHGGWWMPKHNAWFFKNNQEQMICEGGASYAMDDVEEGEIVEQTPETPFSGMELITYGKGYLLVPSENHPDYGTKYYHNGWWMPSSNGWFFKSKYYDSLIEGGAIDEEIIEDSNNECEEYNDTYEEYEDIGPFTNMKIEEYGRGYLLSPEDDHPDFGEKYYHNGWWIGRQNAWFFKDKYYEYLIDNGATHQTFD